MRLDKTGIIHISIAAAPERVASWLSDVTKWKSWAPWVQSARRVSDREWSLETEGGAMTVRFGETNSVGVLDHHVELASGVTAFNALRVAPNAEGSELVMVLYQTPGVSDAEFKRDIEAVADDFARLKEAAERLLA